MTIYNQEQIQESITGYLWYDAPWAIIRAVYPFITESLLDIGGGAGIKAGTIRVLKQAEIKPFEYSVYDGHYRDCIYRCGTVMSSHVMEHIKAKEHTAFVNKSLEYAGKRIIHVVPDGNIQDRNLGTPHKFVFNRVNFLELFTQLEQDGKLKRVHYGPIKGDRMDSLMYVGDVDNYSKEII